MKFNYSFSLTSPTPPVEKLHTYDYNEFSLSLPGDWRQVPNAEENTLNWYSEKAQAGIVVSADFYEVPEEKWTALAEVSLESRHCALESNAAGPVNVIARSIRPYSGGGGLELSYAAETPKTTYLYLGYITSRKVFHFTLTSAAGKAAAIRLYDETMQKRLRVKVP
jgi:hypothetical protein